MTTVHKEVLTKNIIHIANRRVLFLHLCGMYSREMYLKELFRFGKQYNLNKK